MPPAPPGDEAAAALAQADRTRIALLAAVSHDLRTPLAAAKAAVTARMIFMVHGQATPQDIRPHDDLLAHFPYLGPPNP